METSFHSLAKLTVMRKNVRICPSSACLHEIKITKTLQWNAKTMSGAVGLPVITIKDGHIYIILNAFFGSALYPPLRNVSA